MSAEPPIAKQPSICWKTVSSVFIVFGLIGLFTSWVFNYHSIKLLAKEEYATISLQDDLKRVGPIQAKKGDSVEVKITADMADRQSWAFIQGEVQNATGDYLFSFGDELWHESGYDSDGAWTDYKRDYSIDITFPEPGEYYLKFRYESGLMGAFAPVDTVAGIKVLVFAKPGSSIPHLIFGIITLLAGVIMQIYARRHDIERYIADSENRNAFLERQRFGNAGNAYMCRQLGDMRVRRPEIKTK